MKKIILIISLMMLSLTGMAQTHMTYTLNDVDFNGNFFSVLHYQPAMEVTYYEWTPLTYNFTIVDIQEGIIRFNAPEGTQIKFKYYARYATGDELTLIVSGTARLSSGSGNGPDLPKEPQYPNP